MTFKGMLEKVVSADGFIAALDQSGGSTPKALKQYGFPDDAYVEGEESMFDAVHEMRTRIMTSPAFVGDKILGAILFEDTMDRQVKGLPTGEYLWTKKNVVPFIKCDKGLAPEADGVQLMKPMPQLDELLEKAKAKDMFGTKMRSLVKHANEAGIKSIVTQQFALGKRIIQYGLVPIIEPEVDIKSPTKELCEDLLKEAILEHLNQLGKDEKVMLKLTIPTKTNLYQECIEHPNCIRVVALSGGYSRDEANEKLRLQKGMIASFSRALLEGISHSMSDSDFDQRLGDSINEIFEASKSE